MKVCVIGCGYVGLVTGAFLGMNNEVMCFDTDHDKIRYLQEGKLKIYEPNLKEMLDTYSHKIKFTNDLNKALADTQIIFICVGTPENFDGSVNLSYLYEAIDSICAIISNDTLIVIKSTVPIGTTKIIQQQIYRKVKQYNIRVIFNPEFLSQGSALNDILNPSRIIIGIDRSEDQNKIKDIYKEIKCPIFITDTKNAEMIKYVSNSYLALKLSFVNELANLCEVIDTDITEVTYGVGLDKRIGDSFFSAGVGYGGSCFPKDTQALYGISQDNNCGLSLVERAICVNKSQRVILIKKLKKYYDSFSNLNIAVIGASFKPQTNDLRESISLENISLLLKSNAKIKLWDPICAEQLKEIYETENVRVFDTIEETLKDTDVCFIFTEWEEIRKFNLNKYNKLMKKPIVIDGRNCYDLKELEDIKIIYDSIGRKTIFNYNQCGHKLTYN